MCEGNQFMFTIFERKKIYRLIYKRFKNLQISLSVLNILHQKGLTHCISNIFIYNK